MSKLYSATTGRVLKLWVSQNGKGLVKIINLEFKRTTQSAKGIQNNMHPFLTGSQIAFTIWPGERNSNPSRHSDKRRRETKRRLQWSSEGERSSCATCALKHDGQKKRHGEKRLGGAGAKSYKKSSNFEDCNQTSKSTSRKEGQLPFFSSKKKHCRSSGPIVSQHQTVSRTPT